MKASGVQATIELDAADIKHLMSSGSTQVSDENVTVKCRQSLQFQVVTPGGEPWEDEDE